MNCIFVYRFKYVWLIVDDNSLKLQAPFFLYNHSLDTVNITVFRYLLDIDFIAVCFLYFNKLILELKIKLEKRKSKINVKGFLYLLCYCSECRMDL